MSYCNWFMKNDLRRAYHEEWGTPEHDDRKLFEHLSMEVMQCGLSFETILKKREIMRQCFDHFDIVKVAVYDDADVARIMAADGMIHAERKIRAIVHNAQIVQKIQAERGSFADYLWDFTDHQTICYRGHETGAVPASNGLSERASKALKKRGFQFVGPVTTYSLMQACGLINDHGADCPRYKAINAHYPTVVKDPDDEKNVSQL